MTDVNLAVIYYSATGTVHRMAEHAAASAEKAGATVRLRHVTEIAPQQAIESNPQWRRHVEEVAGEQRATPDDVVWADALLFGSPTRFGNVTSQFQQFIDTLGPQWGKGQLQDKVYAGFTSSMTRHGGQESTLLSMYTAFHHFGGIVVSPGYTDPLKFADGNPYGVSHVTGDDNDDPLTDVQLHALEHLAKRVVTVGARLKAGADAA
jgi:NAD(P)H dehydrogenase (quinone)